MFLHVLFSVTLFISISLQAMEQGSSSSSSSSSNASTLAAPTIHSEQTLDNLPYLFTLTNAFDDIKNKTLDTIFKLNSEIHSNAEAPFVFSPDGNSIAKRLWSKVEICDAKTGALIRELDYHHSRTISWSPDSTKIAIEHSDMESNASSCVYVYDVNTGQLIVRFKAAAPYIILNGPKAYEGSAFIVYDLAWSRDSAQLVVSGYAEAGPFCCCISFNNVPNVRPMNLTWEVPHSATWNPDGTRIAITFEHNSAKSDIYDVATGERVDSIQQQSCPIRAVIWHEDGKCSPIDPTQYYLALGATMLQRCFASYAVSSCGRYFAERLGKHVFLVDRSEGKLIKRVSFEPEQSNIGIELADVNFLNDGRLAVTGKKIIYPTFFLSRQEKNFVHIFDIPNPGMKNVDSLTLGNCKLLQGLMRAVNDTKKLSRGQTARIHADEAQWKTWLSFKGKVSDTVVKRLEPYIVQQTENETNESNGCVIQ